MHAAPYLIDDERIPTWQAFYDAGFLEIMDHADEAEYAGSVVTVNNPYGGI